MAPCVLRAKLFDDGISPAVRRYQTAAPSSSATEFFDLERERFLGNVDDRTS
jgi:hypothetical protein